MAKGKARDGRRETRWRRLVRGQQRSGLTVREFCRTSNLRETTFYFWRRELLRRAAQRRQPEHVSGVVLTKSQEQRRRPERQPRRPRTPPGAAPAFLPVKVVQTDSTRGHDRPVGRIEIELPGGPRVHVSAPVDRQALTDVLAVLESRSSFAEAAEGKPC